MAARITLGTLLKHMQGMKDDLQQQIHGLSQGLNSLRQEMSGMGKDVKSLRQEMHHNFGEVHQKLEEARLHREALQEDLYETMRVQAKHGKKLARL